LVIIIIVNHFNVHVRRISVKFAKAVNITW